MMTKTQKVLDLALVDYNGAAVFQQMDEETGTVTCEVTVSQSDYEEMANPQQVTLTVEPGDTLNPCDEH